MAPEYGKPIHQLPLVPADILKKHRVHEPLDTRFRSTARLLQALWREDRDLAIGSYVNEDGKRRNLGSRISHAAGKGGGNFLTPEIAHIARREAAYREIGALIDAERLATNLLSSMPLAFNLLAPWVPALERASGYLIELLPAFTGAARQLLFEHSPGRGNPKFTGDYTAFDAPHARRTGGQRLERPLRLHLLSSAVRVQSIRRSGTLRAASRQRPQRRWVGEHAEAGCRTIQREGLAHLFPG